MINQTLINLGTESLSASKVYQSIFLSAAKTVVYRAKGEGIDDGAPLRALIADADEGTRIFLPDDEYQFYTLDDEDCAISIVKDNIWLIGNGRAKKGTATATGWGGTRLRWRAGVTVGGRLLEFRADGDTSDGSTLTSRLVGGGLFGLIIDANFQADYALSQRSVEGVYFSDYSVMNAVVTGLIITQFPNTAGGANVINHVLNCSYERFDIFNFGTGPGLAVLGNQTYGAESPFFLTFRDFDINYGNQQGMLLNGCDDIRIYDYNPISSSSAADAYSLDITTSGNGFALGIHVFCPTLFQSPKGAIVRATGITTPPKKICFYGLGSVDQTVLAAKLTVEPGARVTIVNTDDGTTSLRPDLAFSTPPLTDDFLTGSLTSGSVGELGWTYNTVTYAAYVLGEAGHPGIARFTIAAGNYGTARPHAAGANSPIIPADAFNLAFIMRFSSGYTDADLTLRFGLGNDPTANPPTNGIYFEKLAADAALYAVCRNAGVETRTSLGTFVGSTWYYFRTRRYNDTTIAFSIGLETNGIPDVTIATNVPTAVLNPFIGVGSAVGSKYLDIDAFQMQLIGLSRMTA